MDKPKYKITILFDVDQVQVSSAVLKDLSMIMKQYGLKPATINVSANDETVSLNNELLEQPTMEEGAPQRHIITDNDGNRRELKLLRFPVERQDIPDDGDII